MLHPHTIKPALGAKHRLKRVGRGNASGHGTYSTRGGKGQTARSGGSRGLKRLGFRRLMQSTPKLRGFKSLQTKPRELYLSELESNFASGDTVSIDALRAKHLLKASDQSAKIISTGMLTKKLTIVGIPATAGAAEKIKAVGGEIK